MLKLGIQSSGWLSNIIAELEASAFIEIQVPFSKKTKDALIKVTDNFSLFIESFKKDKSISNWALAHNSQKWRIWSGLTFENIWFYHKKKIMKALDLSGILTNINSWHHKGNEEMKGAQIDMVIERGDKAFNICEIKYNENPDIITKKYVDDVRIKMSSFNHFTKNTKKLFCTFITSG